MMKLASRLFLAAVLSTVASANDKDVIPLGRNSSAVKKQTANNLEATEPNADVPPLQPKPRIAGIDTYGSTRLNEEALRKLLGADLDVWMAKGIKGDPTSIDLEAKLAERVRKALDFASAEWSIVQYFEPSNFAIHITLDVVEKADVARRMPFQAPPTAELRDPDGILRTWMEYEDLALDMVEAGLLEPEAAECVAFHCPFGHVHPKLKKYEKIFVDGVKKHVAELIEIQGKDKRPERRAAATYLLAYHKDGKKVVQQMVDRIKDSEPMVRNNALRVLGDIAEFHTDLIIPTAPVLEALDFPRVSDGSKSLYILYVMALNSSAAREKILQTSVPVLLQMLTSKQPDHRELAHGVLRKISGREYATTDVQSWKSWYSKLPRMVTRAGVDLR